MPLVTTPQEAEFLLLGRFAPITVNSTPPDHDAPLARRRSCGELPHALRLQESQPLPLHPESHQLRPKWPEAIILVDGKRADVATSEPHSGRKPSQQRMVLLNPRREGRSVALEKE